jgi:hypothetical protein
MRLKVLEVPLEEAQQGCLEMLRFAAGNSVSLLRIERSRFHRDLFATVVPTGRLPDCSAKRIA